MADEDKPRTAQPLWLLALIPLLGVIWGAWFVAKSFTQ